VIAQLLFLQKENKSQDINIYINSPGGSVTAGLAIYDTMQFVQCPSRPTASVRRLHGRRPARRRNAKGKRHALPNSRIMIHQPWGGGARAPQRTSRSRPMNEILRKPVELKNRDFFLLNEILAKHCEQGGEVEQ
jgi:ATP-dependent Clp protease protease subunit